jgi:hypothetical protein
MPLKFVGCSSAHYQSMLDRVKSRLAKGESVGAFLEALVQDQGSISLKEIQAGFSAVLKTAAAGFDPMKMHKKCG